MNGTVDNLREAVLTDARSVAYGVMQEAMRERESILAAADTAAVDENSALVNAARQRADREQQKIDAEVSSRIARVKLEARERAIAAVLAAVRERLGAAADAPEQGRELLARLATEGASHVSGDRVILVVRARDRSRVDGAFLDALREDTGKRAELSSETLPDTGAGGVIVVAADGRERFDNTVESRLARQMADVRALIWARTNHAG